MIATDTREFALAASAVAGEYAAYVIVAQTCAALQEGSAHVTRAGKIHAGEGREWERAEIVALLEAHGVKFDEARVTRASQAARAVNTFGLTNYGQSRATATLVRGGVTKRMAQNVRDAAFAGGTVEEFLAACAGKPALENDPETAALENARKAVRSYAEIAGLSLAAALAKIGE